jgi:hypothetical protein
MTSEEKQRIKNCISFLEESNVAFYTPPPDRNFEELQAKVVELWSSYDDDRYKEEQLGRVDRTINEVHGFMQLWQMLDHINKKKVFSKLSEDTQLEVLKRNPYDLICLK